MTVGIGVSSAQTSSSSVVFAVNAGGAEYTASDGTTYQADTNFDGGTVFSTGDAKTPSDPDIEGTTDDALYQSERYGETFGYDVPVSDGTYEITLKFAEIYQGVSSYDEPDSSGPSDGTNENDRVFSASIEGQQLLTEYDIFADVGTLTATERTYTVEVTDGTLNIDFSTTNNNAKVSAIKVSAVDETDNTAPTVDPIEDQTLTAGESIDVSISSSDADSGDTPSLSLGQAPSFASLSDDGDGTGTVTLAPQAGDSGSYTVEVVADDGTATTTETFTVTVEDATSSGEVVFAVNAGGAEYTASDGTTYQADTNFDGGTVFTTGDAQTPSDPDIEGTTDHALYQSERYGKTFGYDVPVSDGTYEVTLQFAEIYQGVSSNDAPDSSGPTDGTNENDRVFSASIEGEQLLTEYDIFADVGTLTATDKTYTVEVTDGTLNVDFSTTNNNAKISAIKVSAVDETDNTAPTVESIPDQTMAEGESIDIPISSSDADSGDTPSLSLGQAPSFASLSDDGDGTGTVTLAPQAGDSGSYTVEVVADDGTATTTETFTVTVEDASTSTDGEATITINGGEGIDTSTYRSDSFEITNTGNEPIESVTLDLRSAILPDLVFDPEGTAGDEAAKGFVLDSNGTSGTVESTIANPHNGVNGSDGYDTLTITFSSFQPGESITFSVDNDPTSIKGAGSAQNSEAGPVSGLELSGSTVTTEFGDGPTVETALFSDGSPGGSQAVADAPVPSAPTIDVQGVSLTSTTLSDEHTAATVTDADQTITVTGEPGTTATLLRVEGELNLEDVPEYDGTPGYKLEAYEANTAIQVEEYTVTIGSDGTATVPVTLTNSSPNGGFNYFIAVTEDGDGDTGHTSNTVVLKYE